MIRIFQGLIGYQQSVIIWSLRTKLNYDYIQTHRLCCGEPRRRAAEFTTQGRRPVRHDAVESLDQHTALPVPATWHALHRGEEEEGDIGALLNHY